MMPAKKPTLHGQVLHLEAMPKAVKRALRALDHDLGVDECRASNVADGEGGKTTLVFNHELDPTELRAALEAVGKQANIEHDLLMRDDEEDE